MTVGIVLTNGLEAVVIADRQGSGHNRRDDSHMKVQPFQAESYAGVLIGTGNGNIIKAAHAACLSPCDSLPELFNRWQEGYRETIQVYIAGLIANHKGLMEAKASMLPPDEQPDFLRHEQQKVMDIVDNRYREETDTTLVSATYDRNIGRIRLHYISKEHVSESFLLHLEIGSGSDGSQLQLIAKLPGISLEKLPVGDLAFLAMNAYGASQLNNGVGGSPAIAVVDAQGARMLSGPRSVALANVSGAYVSEGFARQLTNSVARAFFADVLASRDPNYVGMADMLGTTAQSLTQQFTPANSWQEAANKKLYDPRKNKAK